MGRQAKGNLVLAKFFESIDLIKIRVREHFHQGGRVHVVGVAINGYTRKAAIEAFREKYDMAFPTLVADPRRFLGHFKAKTGRAFKGTPTFLVYAPDGRLAGVNTGPIDLKRFDAFLDANAG